MTRILYRVLTESGGWSTPFRVVLLPNQFFGGVNGTAFAVIGRKHPGAIGIEIVGVEVAA